MPDTLSPAEQAIADARTAYQKFLDTANAEVFEPRSGNAGLVSLGDALLRANPTAAATSVLAPTLSAAAQQAAGITNHSPAVDAGPPRTADGRFASQPAPAQAAPQAASTGTTTTPAPAAAPSTIPGPPGTQAVAPTAAPASAAPVTGQQVNSSAPAAPVDYSTIPPADALNTPGTRLHSQDWRNLHAKADDYANQAKQLKMEVERLRSSPTPGQTASPPEIAAQLQALTQERDQLMETVNRVAFEQSPQFKEMFGRREQAALLLAKGTVPPDKTVLLESLLKQPDSTYRNQQLNTIVQEIAAEDPIRAGKLTSVIAAMDSLTAEKTVALENSKNYVAHLQAENVARQTRAAQERQAAVSTTFENIAREWKTSVPDLSEQEISLARDVFSGNRSLDDIARAAMWVAVGPKAAATALRLQQQLDGLTAELNRLRVVQPGAANDSGGVISDEPATPQGLEGLIQTIVRSGAIR